MENIEISFSTYAIDFGKSLDDAARGYWVKGLQKSGNDSDCETTLLFFFRLLYACIALKFSILLMIAIEIFLLIILYFLLVNIAYIWRYTECVSIFCSSE